MENQMKLKDLGNCFSIRWTFYKQESREQEKKS